MAISGHQRVNYRERLSPKKPSLICSVVLVISAKNQNKIRQFRGTHGWLTRSLEGHQLDEIFGIAKKISSSFGCNRCIREKVIKMQNSNLGPSSISNLFLSYKFADYLSTNFHKIES